MVLDHEQGLQTFQAVRLSRETHRLSSSLINFVRAAWEIVEPEQPFVDNWHVQELCSLLERMTPGHPSQEEAQRAILNVPPGTMKTLLVSVFWPTWMWARNPRLRILTATYSDKRALDANLKARKIIRSEWFQRYFDIELVEDQNTKGRFDTRQGGWRIATSVGGEGTGLHPDVIVIDDASTAADAMSEVERQAVSDWFSNTVSTRGVTRDVIVIVIGQRLHQEDLSGFLLASPGAASWMHVCWPMRFEPSRPPSDLEPLGYTADQRDHRTQEGELLWPALFPEAKVKQLELDLLEDASGQLQQRPSAKGGRLFKIANFQFFDVPPALMIMVRGWDTGGTEGGGDPSAGIKIGEAIEVRVENGVKKTTRTGRFYVLDAKCEQVGPENLDRLMRTTAEIDGVKCIQREEREGGASGKAVIAARRKLLRGFDYDEVLTGTDKETRSKPFRSQVNGGNVYLPRGAAWVAAYTQELADFPAGKHDDQVDGSSCAFNSLLLTELPRMVNISWGSR
jgi:predicted phage terminase large subunit-like protein